MSLPGLKSTLLRAGTCTLAPVAGLRALGFALVVRTVQEPKPRISIRSPEMMARASSEKTALTACLADGLGMPNSSTSFWARCRLVMVMGSSLPVGCDRA